MTFQSLKCPGASQSQKHSIFFLFFSVFVNKPLAQIPPAEGITVDKVVLTSCSTVLGYQWLALRLHNQEDDSSLAAYI